MRQAQAIWLAGANLELAAKAITVSRVIYIEQVCNCAVRVVEQALAGTYSTPTRGHWAVARYGVPQGIPPPVARHQLTGSPFLVRCSSLSQEFFQRPGDVERELIGDTPGNLVEHVRRPGVGMKFHGYTCPRQPYCEIDIFFKEQVL